MAELTEAAAMNDERRRSQARLRKQLHAVSRYQAHTGTAHRSLEDEMGRESNEDFYRGCHPPGDLHNRHNVDTFVVPYAYNLYNDRPGGATASAGSSLSPASIEIRNMAAIHNSIHAIDELIEYYVIEHLNIGDCDIDGLYMVDRSPTDHVQTDAIGTSSVMKHNVMENPSCHNSTSTLCVPIQGGITVEYDANIVSKEVLQDDILTAIQYGFDNDELIPQASAIQKAIFVGPDHDDSGVAGYRASKAAASIFGSDRGNGVNEGNPASKTVGIIGGILIVIAACLLALLIYRRKKKASSYSDEDDDVNNIWAQEIGDIDADEYVFDESKVRHFL